MKSPPTTQKPRWKIAASARSSSDRDGCVLLDTEKGVFYGANSLGSKIWELIRVSPNGATSEGLLDRIASEVEEVPREQLARDLDEYLQRLVTQGLLTTETLASLPA
jgi:Coenzyme PQQ synthesis protein D (PqqD)